jgi:hypothetical protein
MASQDDSSVIRAEQQQQQHTAVGENSTPLSVRQTRRARNSVAAGTGPAAAQPAVSGASASSGKQVQPEPASSSATATRSPSRRTRNSRGGARNSLGGLAESTASKTSPRSSTRASTRSVLLTSRGLASRKTTLTHCTILAEHASPLLTLLTPTLAHPQKTAHQTPLTNLSHPPRQPDPLQDL